MGSIKNTINLTVYRWKDWIFDEAKEVFLFLCFMSLVTGLILYKAVFIANMPLYPSFWTIYGLIATTFLVSRIPYAYLHKDDHSVIYADSEYPTVSVIIAAKNEEDSIYETIKTCVSSNYPKHIECIIIDDGSTDKTADEILRAEREIDKDIRLIKFEKNQGKREAMAVGINESKNDIIIFVDSDSFLDRDAVRHITEHFLENKNVGAVSGNTKADNADVNLLTRMQSIQYAVSFDIYKASESVHSSVTCCPGCFSAYRRSAIRPLVDSWKNHKFFGSKSTFGDDRGLTNYILKDDWEVVYCEKAKASTKVPEKFKVYLKQQLRWKKSWIREGFFASTFMWKNRHPFAVFSYYVNLSFCIFGPILATLTITHSIQNNNLYAFIVFLSSFILLGVVFGLFVRIYYGAKNWMYMPFVSVLYVVFFMWLMPYALLTLNKTHWGTR